MEFRVLSAVGSSSARNEPAHNRTNPKLAIKNHGAEKTMLMLRFAYFSNWALAALISQLLWRRLDRQPSILTNHRQLFTRFAERSRMRPSFCTS
jgi:hypothetical protein